MNMNLKSMCDELVAQCKADGVMPADCQLVSIEMTPIQGNCFQMRLTMSKGEPMYVSVTLSPDDDDVPEEVEIEMERPPSMRN